MSKQIKLFKKSNFENKLTNLLSFEDNIFSDYIILEEDISYFNEDINSDNKSDSSDDFFLDDTIYYID
ncbi:hypothetical protein CHF27_004130 [Romboutsia maritimum]|uniref:Uncharacterized protein n=1 Tax=Romboutsia maritimum TaxID=2020948 RepID=A0A371IUX8_9FIRM|nr:hypothetical protein [Romboutsia maritimum]RDY24278.1 hypothetical protein CHF27_004130 [Romboutsia maritimum]